MTLQESKQVLLGPLVLEKNNLSLKHAPLLYFIVSPHFSLCYYRAGSELIQESFAAIIAR